MNFPYRCFYFFWKTVLCQICMCGYEIFNRFPFSDSNEDSDTSHPSLSLSPSLCCFFNNAPSLLFH
ncbi:hypothetical protein GLYMA_14G207125v4 [Glycine max]|nr:hypothetical protein GLYMA_14G207125v4 [Glycine max]KAH1095527.1 hypothetical protein GYH30_040691 [Glycine max]